MKHDLGTWIWNIYLADTEGPRMKDQLDKIGKAVKSAATMRMGGPASKHLATVSLHSYLGKADRDTAIPRYHLTLAVALGKAFGCHVYTSKRPHDPKREVYAHDIRVSGLATDAMLVSALWDECVRCIKDNHEATASAMAGLIGHMSAELSADELETVNTMRRRGAEYSKGSGYGI